ncbi:interferon lambda-3 isoform X1 [Xenopus laevis]|uniref:Interferon lambda-3 isoform X1 n=1 Tax=Xenopus laevis TaxID=8355 RepID=A0A8J0TT82_XENLA|nr:interferon lambda-3 isoform X1 [Xenopus laevis]
MEIPIRLAAMMVLLVTVTAHPHRRHCHTSRYRSLSPSDIRAVRLLHNEHEKSSTNDGIKCQKRMFRQKPSVCELKASDRLILTLERVTLAVDVLTNMSESPLSEFISQPLEFFRSLEDDLKHCVSQMANMIDNHPHSQSFSVPQTYQTMLCITLTLLSARIWGLCMECCLCSTVSYRHINTLFS